VELDDPASVEVSSSPLKSRSSSSRSTEPEAVFLSPVVKVADDPPELEVLEEVAPDPAVCTPLVVEVVVVLELLPPVEICTSLSSSKSTSPDAVCRPLDVKVELEPPELKEPEEKLRVEPAAASVV